MKFLNFRTTDLTSNVWDCIETLIIGGSNRRVFGGAEGEDVGNDATIGSLRLTAPGLHWKDRRWRGWRRFIGEVRGIRVRGAAITSMPRSAVCRVRASRGSGGGRASGAGCARTHARQEMCNKILKVFRRQFRFETLDDEIFGCFFDLTGNITCSIVVNVLCTCRQTIHRRTKFFGMVCDLEECDGRANLIQCRLREVASRKTLAPLHASSMRILAIFFGW